MIASMTGYGKAVAEFNGFIFEVEAKSLNNRFLEISIKMPYSIQNKEYELREAVKSRLKRGKVYITINVKQENGSGSSIILNESKLKDTLFVLEKIKTIQNSDETIKLEHVLLFKELFSPELELFDDEHFGVMKTTVVAAVDELNKMREIEGIQLFEDTKKRLSLIEDNLNLIEKNHRVGIEEYFARIKERAIELVKDLANSPERLDFELALLTEKSDIAEECTRLRSHIKMFNSIILNDKEAGRKLNFLCQELHREANTIASKSLSAEIVHFTLSIREEIERIREQVQNIE